MERNPLRANLVRRAELWRWSSLWHVKQGSAAWLSPWPEGRPDAAPWLRYVNGVETEAELSAVRHALRRGAPYGESSWTQRTAARLGLESTLHPRGRPAKKRDDDTD